MIEYYDQPRGFERFKDYLKLLTGGKDDDVVLPIVTFNPMAKEHVKEKLEQLKELNVEAIISEIAKDIQKEIYDVLPEKKIQVSLALADDLKGGWTNRYTTDYQAKFNSYSMLKRNFCNVMFWASDTISEELIRVRTKEYLYRTMYQLQRPEPVSLQDHIMQEAFVAHNAGIKPSVDQQLIDHYKTAFAFNKKITDYPFIFNFLYGDHAARQLGYQPLGFVHDFGGYELAPYLL